MGRKGSWDVIIQKLKSRISTWKDKSLSMGEISTLTKSVLGSIAIYFVSIFKVSIGVINTLE